MKRVQLLIFQNIEMPISNLQYNYKIYNIKSINNEFLL